jgi:transposase InsO family protein
MTSTRFGELVMDTFRIFLGRDGHRMSVGRAYRLWRAAGLRLPRKRPRKHVATRVNDLRTASRLRNAPGILAERCLHKSGNYAGISIDY